MQYNEITSNDSTQELLNLSFHNPIVVFKHSNRCSISRWVWNDFQQSIFPEEVKIYLLNVIEQRPLSNQLAEHFQIRHESPQVLLIQNGKCIYHDSHQGIDPVKIQSLSKY